MDTIRMLVANLPKEVRTLFAVLLIAIATLASTTVYLYNRAINQAESNAVKIEKMQQNSDHYRDSMSKVIYDISTKDKSDAVKNLQEIVDQQKDLIEQQKTKNKSQESTKNKNNVIIKANYDKINSLK